MKDGDPVFIFAHVFWCGGNPNTNKETKDEGQ